MTDNVVLRGAHSGLSVSNQPVKNNVFWGYNSRASVGTLVDRLWDFGHGIVEVAAEPMKTFDQPGKYRVTLIVWDGAGRGGRTEKLIEVVR
ncbi:MAG: PKD domain-containing protein [Planctomycetota bacterium]|nr:PKD domain-containing protein [Planctomycetota bacterium]